MACGCSVLLLGTVRYRYFKTTINSASSYLPNLGVEPQTEPCQLAIFRNDVESKSVKAGTFSFHLKYRKILLSISWLTLPAVPFAPEEF